MKTPTHVIVAALNMYYNGLSVRKVSAELEEVFGESISQVSVWNWVQKFSRMVADYVETLKPSLSGKYHHDETTIRVGGNDRWFWETVDQDTRFIVAHLLTESRTNEDAKTVFKQALEKQRPIALFTDGSFAYVEAVRKVFYTRYKANQVEWVRRVGVRARETNNVVERLHGTLKDRLRPMRGLKHDRTARIVLDGYVAFYNYCRIHQTLGTTPAQSAGVAIKGWKQLIENAQARKATDNAKNAQTIQVEVKS
jgi:transposase-like protein